MAEPKNDDLAEQMRQILTQIDRGLSRWLGWSLFLVQLFSLVAGYLMFGGIR
jgi:hypothetical protein